MPKLSPTMVEGTLVKWHKVTGDYIEVGDLLIEVATDKATVEYHASERGWLRATLIGEGAHANVGDEIALISEEKDEDISSFTPAAEKPLPENNEAARDQLEGGGDPRHDTSIQHDLETPRLQPSPATSPFASALYTAFVPIPDPLSPSSDLFYSKTSGLASARAAASDGVKATPYARALAREQGIDLRSVEGSGPSGRIVASDLEGAPRLRWGVASPSKEGKLPHEISGSYQREEMSPMRRAIAKRLQYSKLSIPHFYVSMDVTMDALLHLRKELKTQGLKLTVNDFILRACGMSLEEVPQLNSNFDSQREEIIRLKSVDICFAVSSDEGLYTPIIRHASYKSVQEISQEVKELAHKARLGKLEPIEYEGGGFTVSNLGMFGVSHFQAIINPPQVAILSVAAPQTRLHLLEGQVVERQVMTMTISCDHRVVDGADAARFLRRLKEILEHPSLLLLI